MFPINAALLFKPDVSFIEHRHSGAAIYSAFRQQMTFNADTMTPSVALVFECMPLVRAFCQRGKHLTSTAKL